MQGYTLNQRRLVERGIEFERPPDSPNSGSPVRRTSEIRRNVMSVDQAYNFRAIDEAVSTSGLLSEEQLSDLRVNGYEAVINLLPHDSQYAIKNEEAILSGQGVDYLYIPVDFAGPTEQDYSEFVKAVKSCQGRKVLIHCAANYRVSAFYAMYAYEYIGWSASQAREHIESIWRPAENPPWDQFISRYIPSSG